MVAPEGVRVGRHVVDPVGRLIGELDTGLTAAGHRSILVADRGSSSAREFVALPEGRGPYLRAALEEIRDATRIDLVHLHHPALLADLPHVGVPVVVTLHGDPRDLEPASFRWRPGVYPHALSAWQRARCPPRTPLLHDILPGLTPHRAPPVASTRAPKVVALGSHERHREATRLAERAGFPVVWVDDPGGWRRYISGAAALWIPDPEAHGLWACAIDALCSGTPLLAARDGALAGFIDEGVFGITYEDDPEFERSLLACTALSRRVVETAGRERYSATAMVERFLAAYSALAGRGAWVHVANAALPI